MSRGWARIIGIHSIHTSLRSYVAIRKAARAKQLARLVRLVFYKKYHSRVSLWPRIFDYLPLFPSMNSLWSQIEQIKQISATLGLPLGGDSNNAMRPYVSSFRLTLRIISSHRGDETFPSQRESLFSAETYFPLRGGKR